MNIKDLRKQACEKVQGELRSLKEEWLKHDKEWLIDHSFEIACLRDIGWFFDNDIALETYFEDTDFEEEMLQDIIDYKGYITMDFYDYYLGMDENFHNISSYEDLAEMLVFFLGYNDYKKEESKLDW